MRDVSGVIIRILVIGGFTSKVTVELRTVTRDGFSVVGRVEIRVESRISYENVTK